MSTARIERAWRIAAHYLSDERPPLEECGQKEGVSAHTAMRDLRMIGIERRHPEPRPKARTCDREGCDRTFQPSRSKLKQGYGKYCSRECDHEAHRIHPKPEPRPCAANCGVWFTPEAWNLAHGKGFYCSRECSNRAQRRNARAKGQLVTCAQCGHGAWRWDCELGRNRGEGTEKEGWFCSQECHAEHRRLYPWPGYRNFISPRASGLARQRVIGAREGRAGAKAAGRVGGKAKGYTELQARGVIALRGSDPTLGRDRLARLTGLTIKQVRTILADAEGLGARSIADAQSGP